jgi:hypothetical protein
MKQFKPLFYLFAALLMHSCGSYERIGQFTMISTRNIDNSKEFALLKKDVEAIVKTKNSDALQDGIDKAVATVENGEYLMNVKIYLMSDGSKLKIVGDVYGVQPVKVNVNTNVDADITFGVGDPVMFTKNSKIVDGTIIGINPTFAIIEYTNSFGKTLKQEVEYGKLTKK